MADILTMLTELAALQAQQLALQAAERRALPQYLRDRLDKIAARFAPEHTECTRAITHVTREVKAAVILHGASVKGDTLHAVYVPGKLSWESQALKGYAVEHPEILLLSEIGLPSVTIRPAKGRLP
jgi:hypothetical protein